MSIEMKYTTPVVITEGIGEAMSMCKCGAVFRTTGYSHQIVAAQKQWDAEHVCPERDALKTFWLSFCDASLPTGSQFLGACVVDVTGDEAEDALIEIALKFPLAREGADWISAASRKAHALGCNPGGEMMSAEIPQNHPMLTYYTRGVLMDRATIERIDDEIEKSL